MRIRFIGTATIAGAALVLSSCGSSAPATRTVAEKDLRGSTIVVATHDSWAMSKSVMAEFTRQTGIKVKIDPNGDVGPLTSKLVLTKGDPIADGTYGVDNTFATRAIDAGVLAPYDEPNAPASLAKFQLPDQSTTYLTPIDYGDVCVNVDNTWFAKKKLAPPQTLDDLVKPVYRGLMVTPGASTSSPGLAFLLATIGKYGDGWQAYWRKLLANGVKVDAGWTDAYEVDYTAGGGHGDRPIVLSYSSSPPDTIPTGSSTPSTSALLDTCFRQVEYAGVLAGAKNPLGMQKFIDFMDGHDFQKALPQNMYVYPVDTTVPLPADWAKFAPTSPRPIVVSQADIKKHRTDWLREWRDLIAS